jgi:phosphate/sulfate permease
VGAVIGIAAVKGMRGIRQVRWRQVGGIVAGWAATPVVAGVLCFFSLFIMQNVFTQTVFIPVEYELRAAELERLQATGLPAERLRPVVGKRIASGEVFLYQIGKHLTLDPRQQRMLLETAEVVELEIDPQALAKVDVEYLGSARVDALRALSGRRFDRRWKLEQALVEQSQAWSARDDSPINQPYNTARRAQLGYVYEAFLVEPEKEPTLE